MRDGCLTVLGLAAVAGTKGDAIEKRYEHRQIETVDDARIIRAGGNRGESFGLGSRDDAQRLANTGTSFAGDPIAWKAVENADVDGGTAAGATIYKSRHLSSDCTVFGEQSNDGCGPAHIPRIQSLQRL